MVQVDRFNWIDGAKLLEHSKMKHQILRKYINEYLEVRCKIPQQSKFRFAVIDGFSGGGAYEGGLPGSPLIFLQLLLEKCQQINLQRKIDGMAIIDFECLFLFNDANVDAIEILKGNVRPILDECNTYKHLNINVKYLSQTFTNAFLTIKKLLAAENFTGNVFFNLDQSGHSLIPNSTIKDILRTYSSAEILMNISAQSLFTYLSRNQPDRLKKTLNFHGVSDYEINQLNDELSKKDWRGLVEKIVFESYKNCCHYVSPFAINNPKGWTYWLMHFANKPKAKQVYNDLLYENEGVQGHFGRSGLFMLEYNHRTEFQNHLFSAEDRLRSLEQLHNDIPKIVSEYENKIQIEEFIQITSNDTPAHSQDIFKAMIDNSDLSITTTNGGERRSHHGIKPTDTLILKPQKSFIFLPNLKN